MSRTDKITLAIFVGAMLLIAFLASGCKSLPGNLEIDTPFFDIEYDLKVAFASITGLGNWLVDIDLVLKIVLSAASLVYIILKIKQLIKDA